MGLEIEFTTWNDGKVLGLGAGKCRGMFVQIAVVSVSLRLRVT